MKKESTLLWILKKSKKNILSVIILSIIGALSSVFVIGLTLSSKKLVDIATKSSEGSFFHTILSLLFFIICQLLIQISFSRLQIKVSGKMEMNFKTEVFKSLLKKDLKEVYKFHSGELLNRLTADVSVVVSGFLSIVPMVIGLSARLISSFIVLFYLDSSFALIYLIAGPVFLFVSRIYRKKMKSLHKKCQETDGKTKSFIQEALANILVIKAFKNENAVSDEAKNLQLVNYNYKLKRNMISIFANILMYLAFTFGYYLAFGWGAYKLSMGLISMGTLTAMIQLVSQIQTPFKDLAGVVPQYYSATASAERIMELYNMDEDKNTVSHIDYNRLYNDMKGIEFNNVSFSYNKNVVVLKDFSDFIKKGDFVALHGISGIGKSTVLKLILGVIKPNSGEIYIVLNNGEKINLNADTRELFAYVPQGNMILSGSIKDNITFYKDNVSDLDIENATGIAQIYDFIKSLPMGFDTIIGEKGLGLSEGQIQRIAIARALITDAPIILLDEATSALDEETELNFLKAVKEINNKTCITVSHKKAVFDFCNKIIEF